MKDRLTWLEVLAIAEGRIEELCTKDKFYYPSTLSINREMRDFALAMLEDKDYFVEKRKKWELAKGGKELTSSVLSDADLVAFMKKQ